MFNSRVSATKTIRFSMEYIIYIRITYNFIYTNKIRDQVLYNCDKSQLVDEFLARIISYWPGTSHSIVYYAIITVKDKKCARGGKMLLFWFFDKNRRRKSIILYWQHYYTIYIYI